MHMQRMKSLGWLCLALACFAVLPAQAGQVDTTDVVFKEVEKRLIREYFGNQGNARDEARDDDRRGGKGKGRSMGKAKGEKAGKKGLPPGLAKRGSLPPGLAKRQELPPGLAKRQLPDELNKILPRPPAGTERVIVNNDVVLIRKATGVVLDILQDAAKRRR